MAWWLWILLGLLLLGLELAMGGGFFLVFFGASALIVGAVVALTASLPIWAEWVVFAVLSIVLLCAFRRRLVEMLGASSSGEVDTLVGKDVDVVQEIAPGAKGQVELRGAPWQGENVGQETLMAGSQAKVQSIDGLVLKIK